MGESSVTPDLAAVVFRRQGQLGGCSRQGAGDAAKCSQILTVSTTRLPRDWQQKIRGSHCTGFLRRLLLLQAMGSQLKGENFVL